jgi:hypothetical protein
VSPSCTRPAEASMTSLVAGPTCPSSGCAKRLVGPSSSVSVVNTVPGSGWIRARIASYAGLRSVMTGTKASGFAARTLAAMSAALMS